MHTDTSEKIYNAANDKIVKYYAKMKKTGRHLLMSSIKNIL